MRGLVTFVQMPRKGRAQPGWWVRVFRVGFIGSIQWIPNSREFRYLPANTPCSGFSEGVLNQIEMKIRQARIRRTYRLPR